MIKRNIVKANRLIFYALFVNLLFYSFTTVAQPSGGPYGPVSKIYELPKVDGTIFYVAVDGKIENDGLSLSNPTTIENAVKIVNSGDAIVMRGGVYRTGNLVLNQGVTIQPYRDEKPVLKGTYIASEWKDLGNGLWITHWDHLYPMKPLDWWRRLREGKRTPLHKFNNDMVFVDGEFLQSAGWEGEVNKTNFFIDYETGTVYIGIDPKDKLVEITAFDVAILRTTKEANGKKSDGKGYTLNGLTFTQYAYRALEIEGTEPNGISREEDHGKEVIGTTIENCSITYCSRVAGYLRGNNMVIKSCKISDTSTEGIYVIASNDVLLEKNIFTQNNIENITGYYPAAVKIFNQSYRVTCNDNLVIDLPNSNGIWYDVGNVDGVFTNNWIQNVGHNDYEIREDQLWPSDNGFFFEISKGCLVAGNVFVNCDHGLMVLNSCNVEMYQNTFINSIACVGRDTRSAQGDHFGWHPSTGPDVDERVGHIFMNNLLTSDESFSRPLLFVWQPNVLCEKLPETSFGIFDNNVFVREGKKKDDAFILWSPSCEENCQAHIASIAELKKANPGIAQSCREYLGYTGPLYKGKMLGNYQLVDEFVGAYSGEKLSGKIKKHLAEFNDKNYVGAYIPVK